LFLGYNKEIYVSTDEANSWRKLNLPEGSMLKNIQGIYQIRENRGLLINDTSGKISFIDRNLNSIGLNYGVLTHSKIFELIRAKKVIKK